MNTENSTLTGDPQPVRPYSNFFQHDMPQGAPSPAPAGDPMGRMECREEAGGFLIEVDGKPIFTCSRGSHALDMAPDMTLLLAKSALFALGAKLLRVDERAPSPVQAPAAGPEWTCVGCGNTDPAKYRTIQCGSPMDPPDYDIQCDECGSTEFEESPILALRRRIADQEREDAAWPLVDGIPFDYPAAARSIALNLAEWFDQAKPYSIAIADAARAAKAEIDRLRAGAPSAGRPMTWTPDKEARIGLDLIRRSYMYVGPGPIRSARKWIEQVLAEPETSEAKSGEAPAEPAPKDLSFSTEKKPEENPVPAPILERSDTAPSLSGSVEAYPGGSIQGASGAQTVHVIGTRVNPDTPSHLTGEAKADPGRANQEDK